MMVQIRNNSNFAIKEFTTTDNKIAINVGGHFIEWEVGNKTFYNHGQRFHLDCNLTVREFGQTSHKLQRSLGDITFTALVNKCIDCNGGYYYGVRLTLS